MYNDYTPATNNEEKPNYNYGEEKQEKPWVKVALAILALVVIVLIIFFGVKACTGGGENIDENSKEDVLIKAAKEYYKKYPNELPQTEGNCVTVTLEVLLKENLISKPDLFTECSKEKTLVTVCKKGNDYEYKATLACEKIKYYYPGDAADGSLVKEFYTSAPNVDYTLFDNETSGVAKWYTENGETKYYNGYASESPTGYPNKGEEGTPVSRYSVTLPATKDYRTISGKITLYNTRTKTIPTTCNNPIETVVGTPISVSKPAYGFGYICAATASNCLGAQTQLVLFPRTCDEQPSLKYTCGTAYTCNGTDKVANGTMCQNSGKSCTTGTLSVDGTKCVTKTCPETYTDWSGWTTNKCTGNSDVCRSSEGYSYVDKVWKWFSAGGKQYYPSGANDSKLENTYYLEAPVEGAIKDLDSVTTGYKYYKLGF